MIKSKEETIIKIFGYGIIFLLAVICLIPFWLILVASISDESDIIRYGYSFFPKKFSFESYKLLFKIPKEMINAYKNSIVITITGTVISLFIVSMTGFVLLQKKFRYRNLFSFLFYFTSIFNSGLIPVYILVATYLGWINNLLALIVPPLLNAWFIMLMRNFMKSIPYSLSESANLDGANDFIIFTKIYLPLLKAALATIGLFISLAYWNDWVYAMMFIEKRQLYPLQYYLYDALNKAKALEIASREADIPIPDLPSQSLKMAIAVTATAPALFLYAFVQKYFVAGITIGAVKG